MPKDMRALMQQAQQMQQQVQEAQARARDKAVLHLSECTGGA